MIVVVPMAGRGARFGSLGVDRPKPLLSIAGRPMIAWAFDSLAGLSYSKVIFVTLTEHSQRYNIVGLATKLAGRAASVIEIPEVTEGQMCTVLAARHELQADEDLLIASADTYVDSSLADDIGVKAAECRGIISVARLPGDHWSFASVGPEGWVTDVAEKERISPFASTGLYYFASGREFVAAADEILARRQKTRHEYYVMPVYREYISAGKRISTSEAREVWDMGTPESMRAFEQHRLGLTERCR
jgi:UDP-N-acetylglucosamine diphosphorylase / glucose-1-phosphate thymidylyltransferase / UDP-N-acetylgalactosamine diphosphorylase / glucosamine-1-phosphate N-acetyltransferase / galactosamine-1-phosphate N-acetyltransferase